MNYNKLINLIKKQEITQKEFAEKVGMTRSGFLGSIKNRTLQISTLEKACEVLNTNVSNFFDNEYTNVVNEPESSYKTVKDIEIESLKKEVQYLKKIIDLLESTNKKA